MRWKSMKELKSGGNGKELTLVSGNRDGGDQDCSFASSKSLDGAKSKKIPTDSFQECRREGNGTKYSIE